MFVEHPLVKPQTIQEREYQRALAAECLSSSTLIVLPTGMGKTVVALLVIAEVLRNKKGKVLFLAPTKPLVEQHAAFLKQNLLGKNVTVMTGEVDPVERELLWIQNDVIVSTPQVVANDLKYGRSSLRDVKLVIFDEAHRGVGNYAYVQVAEEYLHQNGLVMGMTASPGSNLAKIKEVCSNLGIENIEVRSETDPDVVKYLHDIQMEWIEVDVPEQMRRVVTLLRSLQDAYIKELIRLGVMTAARPPTTKYLLEVSRELQSRLNSGQKNRTIFHALSLQAMAIKVGHALELAETQGTTALMAYLEKLKTEASSDSGTKASRSIVSSDEFQQAYAHLQGTKMEHPKLSRVMSIVSNQLILKPESKIIVFTHYRDTCDMVANRLGRVEGAKVARLVGQAGRENNKGLKQKEQVGVLSKFRGGEYNIVVATSVGEEGLDVANTDLVIFYEPVASEIRSIQRRGRTGRSRPGRVIILVTKDTRDEAYLNASLKKEMAMKKRLLTLKSQWDREHQSNKVPIKIMKRGQSSLVDF